MAGAWFPDVLDDEHMVNTSIFPAVNEFQTDLMFKASLMQMHATKRTLATKNVLYSTKQAWIVHDIVT